MRFYYFFFSSELLISPRPGRPRGGRSRPRRRVRSRAQNRRLSTSASSTLEDTGEYTVRGTVRRIRSPGLRSRAQRSLAHAPQRSGSDDGLFGSASRQWRGGVAACLVLQFGAETRSGGASCVEAHQHGRSHSAAVHATVPGRTPRTLPDRRYTLLGGMIQPSLAPPQILP